METMTQQVINGIDTQALRDAIATVAETPAAGQTRWMVSTAWQGGARSDTRVRTYEIGGQTVEKDFTIRIDEPTELCGTNHYANPQEYLMAALNACMMVGYATATAMAGIEVESIRIETEGDIHLAGFMGIDPSVPAGYDEIRYTVYIKGKGTPEQFERVHETVIATSPNRYNIANAIPLKPRLVIES